MIIVSKSRWCARCNRTTEQSVECELSRGKQMERKQTCTVCGKSRTVTPLSASKNGGNGDMIYRNRRAKA